MLINDPHLQLDLFPELSMCLHSPKLFNVKTTKLASALV